MSERGRFVPKVVEINRKFSNVRNAHVGSIFLGVPEHLRNVESACTVLCLKFKQKCIARTPRREDSEISESGRSLRG